MLPMHNKHHHSSDCRHGNHHGSNRFTKFLFLIVVSLCIYILYQRSYYQAIIDDFTSTREQVVSLNNEIGRKSVDLSSCRNDLKQKTDHNTNIQSELDQSKQANSDVDAQLSQANEQVSSLQMNVKNLEDSLNEVKSNCDSDINVYSLNITNCLNKLSSESNQRIEKEKEIQQCVYQNSQLNNRIIQLTNLNSNSNANHYSNNGNLNGPLDNSNGYNPPQSNHETEGKMYGNGASLNVEMSQNEGQNSRVQFNNNIDHNRGSEQVVKANDNNNMELKELPPNEKPFKVVAPDDESQEKQLQQQHNPDKPIGVIVDEDTYANNNPTPHNQDDSVASDRLTKEDLEKDDVGNDELSESNQQESDDDDVGPVLGGDGDHNNLNQVEKAQDDQSVEHKTEDHKDIVDKVNNFLNENKISA